MMANLIIIHDWYCDCCCCCEWREEERRKFWKSFVTSNTSTSTISSSLSQHSAGAAEGELFTYPVLVNPRRLIFPLLFALFSDAGVEDESI